ncbi:MAG: cyclopropane-fatty-acyl-phospholipid synthase family protein [Agarilytica sp.]
MKTIENVSKKVTLSSPVQMMDSLAKKTLLDRLRLLSCGHLIVEDGEDVYAFGQSINESHLVARIRIHEQAAYTQILFGGAIGSGEAYMAGAWSSPELVNVIRVFVLNKAQLSNMDSGWSWLNKSLSSAAGFFRLNTKLGSKKNIAAHYDLSNAFFSLFLDESMMYSSAIFPSEDVSLSQASLIKLERVCQRLKLKESDHLLEIGTGWGGMAIYAAKHYGCKVTTTTISQRQFDMAVARVKAARLEGKVTVLLRDYRDLNGEYDKLVSIEMVEAVGHQFYSDFFARCSRLLKSNGLMLMQAITTQDQRYEREKNKIDFIRKYIFPGGCLPSNQVVLKHIAQDTDMHLVGLDDITLDYALTLNAWKKRFFEKVDEVKDMGFDDVFIRMWDFYLCYCEGGFKERVINTSQFLFAKPMCRELPDVTESQPKGWVL